MPIIWQPTMSVGAKAIDDEHKYLFSLVNCVELALKTGEVASIALFIDQLADYCQEHFAHEEKLQLRIKYPYYLENKTQHVQILENLLTLRQRLVLPQAATEGDEAPELSDYDPDASDAATSGEVVCDKAPIDAKLVAEITELLRKWVLEHVLVVDRKMHPFLSRLGPTKLRELL